MTTGPRYRALLMGNAAFSRDPHALPALRAPLVDIEELRQVLTDDKVGLFPPGNVLPLPDKGVQELREHLDTFFTTAVREEVLLLYYSGHGQLDEHGRLYLCASDTLRDRLRATALSAAEINNMIDGSAAATTIIVLDCCHSGAWKTGADLAASVAGKGRYVLASNKSTQLARDAEVEGQPSPFTGMLVRGLRHAEAPGHLTVGELYRQVHQWITEDTPRPPQLSFAGEGDVVIARRGKKRPWPHAQQLRTRELLAKVSAARPVAPPMSKKNKKKSIAELDTVTAPRAAESFEESWTGKEAVDEFADHDLSGVAMALWFVGLCLFIAAGITWMADDWRSGLAVAIIAGFFLLPMGIPPIELRGAMQRRELQVNSDGITTTDPSGRQHIPWELITEVSVRATNEKVSGHHLVALHVQCKPKAGTTGVFYRPAGWPANAELPAVCHGLHPPGSTVWVPVCVLGPLLAPRRLELKNTVRAHTKRPLETPRNW